MIDSNRILKIVYYIISVMLEALSNNGNGNISSSLINLCHYIAKFYEEEYVSAAGDSGLTFSGFMSAIETASMMNDVGINTSQLRILFRILQHKIGAKLFEPESKMVDLRGEMIVPQIGEYKYIHEIGSNPGLILYWVRDSTTIFNKEISLLIKCNIINVDNISSIDVIVGSDHGQGAFRFPMKLLFIMKSSKNVEHESSVAYILCKKDNDEN